MSVTFWMPQAPLERYQPFEDEPDYWATRPAAPFTELNLANGNAAAFMTLIDPNGWALDPYGGEWAGETLNKVFSRLMMLRNTRLSSIVETPDEQPAPNYTICGRDTEYVRRRLNDFLNLVRVAREHGFYVCWG